MNSLKTVTPPPSVNSVKPNQVRTTNLLESFKDQAKAASIGVMGSALDQLTGRYPKQQNPDRQNQSGFNFEEYLRLREEKVKNQERSLFAQRRSCETLVFYRKEEIAKQQIEIIKQEIKALAKQTGNLSVELCEAEKAVSTRSPDVKTGAYYMSFFERIKNLIVLARKRITESRTWLGEFTSRCQTKSYYWQQFGKSGTKFGLSQERTAATQTG